MRRKRCQARRTAKPPLEPPPYALLETSFAGRFAKLAAALPQLGKAATGRETPPHMPHFISGQRFFAAVNVNDGLIATQRQRDHALEQRVCLILRNRSDPPPDLLLASTACGPRCPDFIPRQMGGQSNVRAKTNGTSCFTSTRAASQSGTCCARGCLFCATVLCR